MADHQEASVTLPSRTLSVPEARRFVTEVLDGWGLPPAGGELAENARLIVSELVTNAVLHTRGQSPTFTVGLRLERDEILRIGVTDSHPGLPRRPALGEEFTADGECQDNGRGMDIVRCLTALHGGELSVTPTPEGGKTVWTVLPVTAADA
ncbi:sensor histidine kinase [Streptomyces sp. NA04227]|uniref:ATP-binding protein n=1 Tax=Streptomyces sp. NA04227 TaxID=2742136 RepID=UPI00158FFDC8|nr:ATP-binding protein [Streptomyces sp. NA04227]QKW05306.1 sensor histidine kinase [Streptomyces sp. NA04227]